MLNPEVGLYISMLLFGAAGAYMVGIAMNGLMSDDGFGTLPNTVILMAGGFLGFYLPKFIYISGDNITVRAVLVVSGAFICLALLAVLKALLNRLGY